MNCLPLLWSLLTFCFYIAHGQVLEASYCYGDNSGGSSNLVNVVCSPNVVHVLAIITASKPLSLGCPAESHAYSNTTFGDCCTSANGDCQGAYNGNTSAFDSCNGEVSCTGKPVVRTWTDAECDANNYAAYSNYMVFQYRCVEPYNLHGACNTTVQCYDEYAVCDTDICECGPQTRELDNKCYRDGYPNGKCNEEISCVGNNVTCVQPTCTCDTGFSVARETCVQDGDLGGRCSDTIPCTDAKAVCSPEGVCECVSGYEERNAVCVKAGYDLINETVCYGDSSHNNNLINVTCDAGVIYLYDIIAGSKPITLNCPEEDHLYTAADYEKCCTLVDGADCLTPYTGDWSGYRACDGLRACSGVPVIRIETDPLCNASMGGNTYKRYSNYMIFQYFCVPDYRLHGACNTTEQCTDEDAMCNKNVCLCDAGFTEIEDSCIRDGSIGGICNASIPCEDQNAECSVDGICDCKNGFSYIDDLCLEDGKAGGNCIGGLGGVCTDGNAECSADGLCECKTGYSEVNTTCVEDGSVGGKCDTNGTCSGDHTECNTDSNLHCGRLSCDPGICSCIAGYSPDAGGVCVEDGTLGGHCSETVPCDDSNAVCSTDGVCECEAGYTEIGGVCMEDGVVGGFCNTSIPCDDDNAVCSTDNVCVCNTVHRVRNYVCIPDGDVGGRCQSGQCNQANTTCSDNDTCVCIPGFSEVNRTCKQDGDVLGKCKPDGGCKDVNAECDTSSPLECGVYTCDPGVCTCDEGYSPGMDDTCFEDGSIGGKCSATIPCNDSNAECSSSSVCQCRSGYTVYLGKCVADGEIGGRCSVDGDCVDHAVCSDNNVCVCKTGYSDVDSQCQEDGSVGGKCDEDSGCSGSFTTCDTSTSAQCGATTCSPGICTCQTGYSVVDASGTCKRDGDVGGRCGSNSDCDDGNAICDTQSNICVCSVGFTDINGVCKEDGEIGGRCSTDGDCVDRAVCSPDSVCVCQTGYSDVDSQCLEDGSTGGKCDEDSGCSGSFTTCDTSTSAQCGTTTCSPGICTCQTGYSVVDASGTCKKDGDVGGRCGSNSDCDDGNAICDTQSNICVCSVGFTDINDVCKEDGDVGGRCGSNSDCDDGNAICDTQSNICVCSVGFTDINDVCKEDGEVGGRCSTDGDCVDRAVCSPDSVCVCQTGYSDVDSQCLEDGSVGGKCDEDSGCSGSFTTCDTSTSAQCGATTCSPGICTCQTGYSIVDASGACKKDGDLGGKCSSDSDCHDGNARCDTQTDICVCPSSFTIIDGACQKDGAPDGACLGFGTPCLDAHAVCDNGVCRCNGVRNYVNQDGTCVRDDDEIHGDCDSKDSCNDNKAQCSLEGTCECQTGYAEVNGECKKDETPTVTACDGDDPYNALQPDCPAGDLSLVLRNVTMVKPAGSQCPATMDTYDEDQFRKCCTPAASDCEVVTDIATDCGASYLSGTSYRKIEYVCINENDTVATGDDDEGTGRPVYLTSPDYPGSDGTSQSEQTCSVQASCLSNIDVFLLLNELAQTTGSNCLQTLEIMEGSATTRFTCDYASGVTAAYTSSSGYFVIKLMSTGSTDRGKFVLKFEAQTVTADVTVSCGNQFVASADDLGACLPSPGALGGACSTTFPCSAPYTVCVQNVCKCQSGYVQSEDGCSPTVDGGGTAGSSIAPIIGGVIAGLLALAALAAFLLRRRIRQKLCPKEEEKKPLEEVIPITHAPYGPTPGNVKFPGRADALKVEKRKTLPPLNSHTDEPFMDYVLNEQTEEINMRNSMNGALPALRPGEDSVGRTQFSRSGSSALLTIPNGFSQSMRANRPDKMPEQDKPEKTEKPENKDKEKKRKKKRRKMLKSLQKARVGITASSAFEAPLRGQEGTYRRLPEVGSHPPPAPQSAGNALPPFPPDAGSSGTPHPPPNLGNAPVQPFNRGARLSQTIGGNMANGRGPKPPDGFQPGTQWRRAGFAATMTSSLMRRHSTLDISNVNDPENIETLELES